MSQASPPRAPSPRAARTRALLLRAGRDAFARKGLAAVNLRRDVLEPAGVSVGSFYHQFGDKTDLLLEILAEHSAAQRERFHEVHRPDRGRTGQDIARSSYALVFDAADEHEEVLRILARHRGDEDPRIRRFIEADQARWRRSLAEDYARLGEGFGFELQVELAADLIGMLAQGAIESYLALPRSERPKARERLIDGLVAFTLHGLAGLAPRAPRPVPHALRKETS